MTHSVGMLTINSVDVLAAGKLYTVINICLVTESGVMSNEKKGYSMAKLIESDLWRKRYFERNGPSDDELKEEVSAGRLRGVIMCGKVYLADDALFNNEPWQPTVPSSNPLLAAR